MYSVKVEKILPAYRNAGMYVKKKYGCLDISDVIYYMEKEFSLDSRIASNFDRDHYFDFKSEKDYVAFLLRWL